MIVIFVQISRYSDLFGAFFFWLGHNFFWAAMFVFSSQPVSACDLHFIGHVFMLHDFCDLGPKFLFDPRRGFQSFPLFFRGNRVFCGSPTRFWPNWSLPLMCATVASFLWRREFCFFPMGLCWVFERREIIFALTTQRPRFLMATVLFLGFINFFHKNYYYYFFWARPLVLQVSGFSRFFPQKFVRRVYNFSLKIIIYNSWSLHEILGIWIYDGCSYLCVFYCFYPKNRWFVKSSFLGFHDFFFKNCLLVFMIFS